MTFCNEKRSSLPARHNTAYCFAHMMEEKLWPGSRNICSQSEPLTLHGGEVTFWKPPAKQKGCSSFRWLFPFELLCVSPLRSVSTVLCLLESPPHSAPRWGKKFCHGYKMRQGLYKLSAGSCSSGTSDSLTRVVRPKTRDNSGYK